MNPLRFWPGVVAAVAAIALRFAWPTAFPGVVFAGLDSELVDLLGSMIGTVAIIIWWPFFSRAPWAWAF